MTTEDIIEELMARSDAQDAILQAIAGQVAILSGDWRDALDTTRLAAEIMVRQATYNLPAEPTERLRRRSLAHIEDTLLRCTRRCSTGKLARTSRDLILARHARPAPRDQDQGRWRLCIATGTGRDALFVAREFSRPPYLSRRPGHARHQPGSLGRPAPNQGQAEGVRDCFGARIMGTVFGCRDHDLLPRHGGGAAVGGWIFDGFGDYAGMHRASLAVGLGAVAIALTFSPLPPDEAAPQATPRLHGEVPMRHPFEHRAERVQATLRVLLLGMMMPAMSGPAMLAAMAAHRSWTASRDRSELLARAGNSRLNHEGHTHLRSPITAQEVLEAIATVLGERRGPSSFPSLVIPYARLPSLAGPTRVPVRCRHCRIGCAR